MKINLLFWISALALRLIFLNNVVISLKLLLPFALMTGIYFVATIAGSIKHLINLFANKPNVSQNIILKIPDSQRDHLTQSALILFTALIIAIVLTIGDIYLANFELNFPRFISNILLAILFITTGNLLIEMVYTIVVKI